MIDSFYRLPPLVGRDTKSKGSKLRQEQRLRVSLNHGHRELLLELDKPVVGSPSAPSRSSTSHTVTGMSVLNSGHR